MRRDKLSLKLYSDWMEALSYADFCADEWKGSREDSLLACLQSAAYACNLARKAFERYAID